MTTFIYFAYKTGQAMDITGVILNKVKDLRPLRNP
jgi:hypothetical protein